MTPLPTWADNATARALLQRIAANPPEYRIVRDDWGASKVYRTHQQPDVAALKRLYAEWWEANYATAQVLPLSPDELIERVLGESRLRAGIERDLRFAIEQQRRVA